MKYGSKILHSRNVCHRDSPIGLIGVPPDYGDNDDPRLWDTVVIVTSRAKAQKMLDALGTDSVRFRQ